MIVFRLANKKYCHDLSGTGAEITGGRWNFKGTKLLYTADSRALCMAEIAVHTPVGLMPVDYYLITIEVPDYSNVKRIESDTLSANWKKFPYSNITQKLGEDFVSKNEDLYIEVPSAVVQGDFNILINPRHSDFDKIKIIKTEKFNFDERLFR
ncbi:RES family NAD+ phosphorylase [Anaerophaga thermohalophila]|uniref:RES family NAD+ phosphorylase n=1 Tax=Anaerophaga thermohalophila TaxID=177400 RepID=UPI000237BD34|nr:RES family NAD+ phosphorylase [Anaerophaga thermohalophila]